MRCAFKSIGNFLKSIKNSQSFHGKEVDIQHQGCAILTDRVKDKKNWVIIYLSLNKGVLKFD